MHFKIITVGWDCAGWIEQTLASVEEQSYSDWKIHIVSDPTDDPAQERVIREWCDARDPRKWMYTINTERKFVVRNQVEGIRAMNPDPEDVIVYLDLDGDTFAHQDVLAHLVDYYSDDTLVTYGSYRPVPDMGTCTMAHAFPEKVIADGDYRRYLRNHACAINHLRTIKYKILQQIPDNYFQFPNGEWLKSATDYAVMTAALELAGGKHKFIEEVLLLYNHAQPHPDYKYHPKTTAKCATYILHRAPLVEPKS